MADGDPLPPDHTLGIQCPKTKWDPDSGEAKAALFHLREDSNESYCSGAWLEHTGLPSQVDQIREVCRQIASYRKVTDQQKIALLLVGDTQERIQDVCKSVLDFLHHPKLKYETHSGIHGIEKEPRVIPEELAKACNTVPAILK